jgi:SAM-dependent methyltransferase
MSESHGTGHGDRVGPADPGVEPAPFWEARYGERDQVWSGEPNDALVAVASDLQAGRALDLGCGEGGDSIWLARQGWRVTAVDIAATAVARGRRNAGLAGIPEDRIDWILADLSTWEVDGPYDLVSACFLHSPVEFPRTEVLRRAADAVAPGGRLLIVGHAEPPPWAAHYAHAVHAFPSPAEELAGLRRDDGWEVLVCEVRSRTGTGPDGEQGVLRDNVLVMRRH